MTEEIKESITSDAPVEGSKLPSDEPIILKQQPDNEPVTITRGQLKTLLERLEAVETKGVFKRPKRVTERTALLRFHNDKPVVWYGNVHEVLDKLTGNKIAYMSIKLSDETSYKVEYLNFLNSANQVQVLIKEQKAEEVIDSSGTRMAENPDEAKITIKRWQAREVEMEVVSYKYTATVEVLDGSHKGELFTIPTDCLNQ